MEKRIELLDLPPVVRQLVGECEVTGRRTIFDRDGRPVAMLISYDEYLALRETVEIASDADLRRQIEAADEEARGGKMLAVEDLLEQ